MKKGIRMMKKIESVSHEIVDLLCLTTSKNRVEKELEKYLNQAVRVLYLNYQDHELVGFIGIEKQQGDIVIAHIGVLEPYRHQKIGSSMIDYVVKKYRPAVVSAETDAEGVGFYQRYGFEIQSLGEKYPGVERFNCVLDVALKSGLNEQVYS